ncbi:MAG: DNA topoisomerase 4 subunit A [Hydrogenobacter thermophilus]|uniref:DNA gyrase/topoisomerase IV subunit A n=1 Tax=Hydrogenobacter thermophilus TaxID=940 RepID=UPI001C77F209|nr:DNA topoisomerase (ATP-hydrolyzing) [Hydrogenobacter thermophilus]QWK19793.1 MAG: DNA topoisomerase 4 subunit A [Hydrogenobacter thermophilus]
MEITTVAIEEEVKQSYIDYAMSVIVGRAIPDARDGLKPVQRRILYAMYQMGLTPEKPFVKSARIVGTVLGYYHPHGDQAVYDALVRMAQDFNMRYPLIIGQGNFGSIDGDPPAAMRYSEAKLSKVAIKMLEDIEEDTVDFIPNFDGSTVEPAVLPSKFPNMLCNGSTGIAVGLATSIPPHNLREVCSALIELAKNPSISTEEIMKCIKGPDFPTGGIVENYQELIEYYHTGRGHVRVRAKAHVEKLQGGREQIVITEIPYQVNKAELIKRMAELVREGKLKEISEIRDESDKEGIRIVIELKRDAQGQKVLEKLYKHTALRKSFPINFVVLIDNQPKQVGIKELLQEFLRHRLEVILRRAKHHLKKAEDRLHIVEGLTKALEHLDKVIQDIRSSKDVPQAKEKLMKNYTLSERQANAVLDMRLQRLTSLESSKLEEEKKQLIQSIEHYKKLISSEEERIKVFIQEMEQITKEFPSPRKTFVLGFEKEEVGQITVIIYSNGKIMPLEEMQEEGQVVDVLDVPFSEGLFMVSNRGRVYWIAGSQALQGSKVSFKEADESVVGAFVRSQASHRIILITKRGYVKKIPIVDFEYKAQGMSIIKFSEEEDEVVKVLQSPEEGDILLLTRKGKMLRFPIRDIPPATVGSKGVIGIKLEGDDTLISARAITDFPYLLLITQKGAVKKINAKDIPARGRGGKGMTATARTKGDAVDIVPIRESVELMIATQEGKAFYDRLEEREIPLKEIQRWSMDEDIITRVVVKKAQ